ncbi:endospore germination permease [Paenibacillus sp. P25]|nr:endospore germination permease [Paenibacillus sp. P25]
MEKEKITPTQFSLLVNMFTVGDSILIVPSGLAAEAGQDAWLAALLTIGIGLLLVRLYASLAGRFPGKSLVQYTELILGKWAGKVISLWFFTFCLLFSSFLIRDIGEFVVTHNLPNTPVEVVNIIFLCLMIMGVRGGMEPLARTVQIFFPLLFLFFVFSVLTLTPQIEPEHILPVFEAGMKPVIRAVIPFVGIPYLELVLFLMIIPYVSDTEKAKSSLVKGMLVGSSTLFTVIVLSILVLGPELTARETYPSYALVKKINVGHFLQRIEAIMAAVWFLTIYIKATVTFFPALRCSVRRSS